MPMMEASAAKSRATTTLNSASSLSPLPRLRTQPLPVKPAKRSGKQIKHKTRDPNADCVFHHRSRFTKFKRRIHEQRRWVLERHTNNSDFSPDGEEDSRTLSYTHSSSFISEKDLHAEVSMEEEAASSQSVGSPSPNTTTHITAAAAVREAVAAMDALFLQLDAAMKQHRFGRAAFLKRCLRARQHRLRRHLESTPHTATSARRILTQGDKNRAKVTRRNVKAGVTAPTTITAETTEVLPMYRSFHPSSTWLGVGRHPRSDWVDQRSGRYPKTCLQAQIQLVLRTFRGDTLPDSFTATPTDYAYLIPAPPPASVMMEANEDVSRAHTSTVVSSSLTHRRAQRQQKGSLYVGSYCTNIVTDALDDLCFTLLQGLYKEQRDLRQKQPLQFKARQRYVVGFQEVLKCLKAGRVKLVLLAADLEAVKVSDAQLNSASTAAPAPTTVTAKSTRKKAFQTLYEAVTQVQQLCGATKPSEVSPAPPPSVHAVPGNATSLSMRAPPLCITCMSRQRLSYALFSKGSKVACVGVMQAEKNREALKAVIAYGQSLTHVYANEGLGGTPT